MATTPEGYLKNQVKAYLKSIGAWFFMPVPTGFGVRGVPDFIGCLQGKFFAIETKTTGRQPTVFQEMCIAAIKKAGGAAGVAYTLEEAKDLLGELT